MPLTLRQTKGSKLTIQEMDANLTYLESLVDIPSLPDGKNNLSENSALIINNPDNGSGNERWDLRDFLAFMVDYIDDANPIQWEEVLITIGRTETTYSDGRSPLATGMLDLSNSIELLPSPSGEQYYEIDYMFLEYIPDNEAYSLSDTHLVIYGAVTAYVSSNLIKTLTKKGVLIKDFYSSVFLIEEGVYGVEKRVLSPGESIQLLTLLSNNPTGNGGTLKITIKYKVNSFTPTP